ncbi:MAG: 50S ribosomal protein L23 [Selenomonadaceae bacterium]|uniref:Large ribosomal subunit protein uL23 n=1 Tax=Anaerovibrio slackiae TaxID=2652309 RepID=A0A6I2U970_9FIRM|nr:50S ribosomal protein L23 [Anaerovibrio slackiae]MBQ2010083.1 50S ribosomal protein L23 [Selenomonadaceae bacterium]MBQ2409758.1 50S ribosomal protein L23 [Selenomonadaceae bacterium]MBQ5584767.1 50S ribosomal protein L23 [Selenomonadaceae bacterium]MBQ5650537.1 50S ribosomal protein L23 [Selenomonadaceae bacterium]MBQ5731784.1 50S ribosomal protein L23 [Selenomonadaceae bacterium]
MEARDIIIRPLITEKSTTLMAEGKYVFEVAKSANKIEIAKAISQIFKVKVASVNTINVEGKVKRMGRSVGKRSDYKKAIVKLAAGETIEFFEA